MSKETEVHVYLTRHNLLTLLAKLDRVRYKGEHSFCSLLKQDTQHKQFPQSHRHIMVTAVENKDYYVDREPGRIAPADAQIVYHSSECQLCGLDFEA